VVVQYNVKKTSSTINNEFIIFIIPIFIIFIIILFFILNKFKKPVKKDSTNTDDTTVGYSFKGLSERQKDIMKLLIEEKRSMTQTEIQKQLNIPKSAVSRNVSALELKDLVEKETIGMSNLIRLKRQ
jgi:uncharacterized membrane protein